MIAIMLAIPFGIIFFLALTRGINAHLRGLKDKLAFFAWPFPPNRMLIVKELDGQYRIYYDNEFEEIAGEDRTIIKTIYGDSYVTDIPFSQASISRSMFSTWGPEGHYTPYSLSWRWAVAASVAVYMTYYAFIMAMFDFQYTRFMVATIAFMLALVWLLTNAMRMQDKTIAYAWYHSIGINPPHQKIIPAVALSSLELPDYLAKLGRQITINVPDDVAPVINKLTEKVGSKSLAAVIIAKLAMANAWRQGLAQAFRESYALRKAGETAAMIRLGQPTGRRMFTLAVVALFAFVLGFAFGNIVSIGVEPVGVTNTTTTAAAITPAPQPAPPIESTPVNETITPAEPPPPPGGE